METAKLKGLRSLRSSVIHYHLLTLTASAWVDMGDQQGLAPALTAGSCVEAIHPGFYPAFPGLDVFFPGPDLLCSYLPYELPYES
jgi:hypothetical protein